MLIFSKMSKKPLGTNVMITDESSSTTNDVVDWDDKSYETGSGTQCSKR